MKFKNRDIKKLYGDTQVKKLYYLGNIIYWELTEGSSTTIVPAYAVVDDIDTYNSTSYLWAYNNKDESWYTLNNNNEYEKYGVYENVDSLETVTKYIGKLVVSDGREYKWNGSEWEDCGEVVIRGINFEYGCNYNAKDYDSTSKTIPNYNSSGAIDTNMLITSDVTQYEDHISITNTSGFGYVDGYTDYVNRVSSDTTKRTFTIITKAKTLSGYNLIANRYPENNYNWMYRQYSSNLTLHGTGETGNISIDSTKPAILCARVDSNNVVKYNNYTANTSSSTSNFKFGNTSNAYGFVFFQGGYYKTTEPWMGDFYWAFISNRCLTDEEVQKVIEYNENGLSDYPVAYTDKPAPSVSVSFSSIGEMNDYTDVYVGLIAKVNGKLYMFSDNFTWVEMSSSITFDLQSQWRVSNASNPYDSEFTLFESFSNYNVPSSNASFKVTFSGYKEITFKVKSYGERSFDYLFVGNLDDTSPSISNYYWTGNGNNNQWCDVKFSNLDGYEHFVIFTYRKDGGGDYGDDRGYVAIPFLYDVKYKDEVVTDDCIRVDSGDYRQKILKYQSFDNGVTWINTGVITGVQLPTTTVEMQDDYTYEQDGYNPIYHNIEYYRVTLPNGSTRDYDSDQITTRILDYTVSSESTYNIHYTSEEGQYYISTLPDYYTSYYCDVTLPNGTTVRDYYSGYYVDTTTPLSTRASEDSTSDEIIIEGDMIYKTSNVEVYIVDNWYSTKDKTVNPTSTPQQIVLPSGYTQLQYINNPSWDNYAYIDTGVLLNYDTKVEIEFKLNSTHKYMSVLGGCSGTPGNKAFFMGLRDSMTNYICIHYANSWNQTFSVNLYNRNLFVFGDGKCIINGNENNLSGNRWSDGDSNCLLFATSWGGGIQNNNLAGDVYRFRAWDGDGNLLKFLIPCMSDTGEVGMFDLVNNVFFGSGNSDYQFTAGPEI